MCLDTAVPILFCEELSPVASATNRETNIYRTRNSTREERERERYQQQSFSGVTQSTRAQVKQTSKAAQHADVVNRGAGAKRGLGGERSSDLTVSRSHPEYQINHIQLCEGSTKETFKLAADYRTFPCAWRLKGWWVMWETRGTPNVFRSWQSMRREGKKEKEKKKVKDHFHKEPTDQAKTNITLIALISNKLRWWIWVRATVLLSPSFFVQIFPPQNSSGKYELIHSSCWDLFSNQLVFFSSLKHLNYILRNDQSLSTISNLLLKTLQSHLSWPVNRD